MDRPERQLVSLDRYSTVFGQFLEAIATDDVTRLAFDAWVDSGKQGEGPLNTDAVGDLSRSFLDMGMPVTKMVIIREAAYREVEEAERREEQVNE